MLTSFDTKGLFGYEFGPLEQKDFDILYVEVEKGHDTFIVSKRITRIYYILSGSGYFTIADRRYDVSPGMLVEIPPNLEYSYSGKMKLIVICKPRWFAGNDRHTKWNPDVVQSDLPLVSDGGPRKIYGLWKVFAKFLIKAFLRINQRLWSHLPVSFYALGPVRSYGDLLHSLARIQGGRAQAPSTFFLRNRPQLELMQRLIERSETDTLRVAVLGCSTGAEAYSIGWRIRSARPDMKVILHAVDISKRAVEFGKRGTYSLKSQLIDTDIFERMTETEINEMFDRDGDVVRVKSWIKEGIKWHVGDVADSETLDALGPQDIVVASNFLCHMRPSSAERCLRNIAQLVRSHGYLFISGVDLDVRTKVARDLGWCPVQELLEEIHEGDPCMKTFWPWHYAGLEPLNRKRKDWKLRYAAAFQLVPHEENAGDSTSLGISAAALPVTKSSRVSDPRQQHTIVEAPEA
jgi:mannose-6-phosphate isomerase-like protein (cupin superfamily)/SAM-dependent methyltransferase